jgi:hypothetical protein
MSQPPVNIPATLRHFDGLPQSAYVRQPIVRKCSTNRLPPTLAA